MQLVNVTQNLLQQHLEIMQLSHISSDSGHRCSSGFTTSHGGSFPQEQSKSFFFFLFFSNVLQIVKLHNPEILFSPFWMLIFRRMAWCAFPLCNQFSSSFSETKTETLLRIGSHHLINKTEVGILQAWVHRYSTSFSCKQFRGNPEPQPM